MPATFRVTEGRNQKMSFSGAKDSIEVTWHQDYYVDILGVDPRAVTAYDVISCDGLPVVNRSIYFSNGKVIPYVICRGKSAEQMPDRLSRWKVSTNWKATRKTNSEESDNQPITPPDALTDLAPRVVLKGLEVFERVLYEDKAGTVCDRTPARSVWSEPLIEKVPAQVLQITQYESGITYQQMQDRKLTVNDDTYRGKAAHTWLITEVEATEVDITLATGTTAVAQVTYTVAFNPNDEGWDTARALVDTHHLVAGERKAFEDILDQGTGYINETGTMRTLQTGAPDYIVYETYSEIDFDSFLQV